MPPCNTVCLSSAATASHGHEHMYVYLKQGITFEIRYAVNDTLVNKIYLDYTCVLLYFMLQGPISFLLGNGDLCEFSGDEIYNSRHSRLPTNTESSHITLCDNHCSHDSQVPSLYHACHSLDCEEYLRIPFTDGTNYVQCYLKYTCKIKFVHIHACVCVCVCVCITNIACSVTSLGQHF